MTTKSGHSKEKTGHSTNSVVVGTSGQTLNIGKNVTLGKFKGAWKFRKKNDIRKKRDIEEYRLDIRNLGWTFGSSAGHSESRLNIRNLDGTNQKFGGTQKFRKTKKTCYLKKRDMKNSGLPRNSEKHVIREKAGQTDLIDTELRKSG